jgi:hypothetical protein
MQRKKQQQSLREIRPNEKGSSKEGSKENYYASEAYWLCS